VLERQLEARQRRTCEHGRCSRIGAERDDCSADERTSAPTPISHLDVPYPEGATGDSIIVLTVTVERHGTESAVSPDPPKEPFASLGRHAPSCPYP
jgi:hypothetical protein